MAFVVEYIMKRPDTSVEFPLLSEKDQLAIEKLREEYCITSSTTVSDDGLTWTMRQSTDVLVDYGSYYEAAGKHWDNSKVVSRCADLNIDITMDVVENN